MNNMKETLGVDAVNNGAENYSWANVELSDDKDLNIENHLNSLTAAREQVENELEKTDLNEVTKRLIPVFQFLKFSKGDVNFNIDVGQIFADTENYFHALDLYKQSRELLTEQMNTLPKLSPQPSSSWGKDLKEQREELDNRYQSNNRWEFHFNEIRLAQELIKEIQQDPEEFSQKLQAIYGKYDKNFHLQKISQEVKNFFVESSNDFPKVPSSGELRAIQTLAGMTDRLTSVEESYSEDFQREVLRVVIRDLDPKQVKLILNKNE